MPLQSPTYTFDEKTGQYRRRGKFVKIAKVLSIVDKYLGNRQGNTADKLFDLLRAGQLSVKEVQIQGAKELSKAHLSAYMAAKGGKWQMSASDYGKAGNLVKSELKHWRDLMKELSNGRPLDGSVKTSFRAYFAAAANTFMQVDGDEAEKRGFDEEAYVLNDGARHCIARSGFPSCTEVAARGYQKRGTLPQRGRCACRWGCQCGRKRRNSGTGEIRD